ncbi:hypothetical protein ANCDUO_26707, partial [Ancylostoma duodenale]
KNTINVPLNDIGMCDSDYLAIFQLVVHPIINDFKPDIILVSCGFDAALGRCCFLVVVNYMHDITF